MASEIRLTYSYLQMSSLLCLSLYPQEELCALRLSGLGSRNGGAFELRLGDSYRSNYNAHSLGAEQQGFAWPF